MHCLGSLALAACLSLKGINAAGQGRRNACHLLLKVSHVAAHRMQCVHACLEAESGRQRSKIHGAAGCRRRAGLAEAVTCNAWNASRALAPPGWHAAASVPRSASSTSCGTSCSLPLFASGRYQYRCRRSLTTAAGGCYQYCCRRPLSVPLKVAVDTNAGGSFPVPLPAAACNDQSVTRGAPHAQPVLDQQQPRFPGAGPQSDRSEQDPLAVLQRAALSRSAVQLAGRVVKGAAPPLL